MPTLLHALELRETAILSLVSKSVRENMESGMEVLLLLLFGTIILFIHDFDDDDDDDVDGDDDDDDDDDTYDDAATDG